MVAERLVENDAGDAQPGNQQPLPAAQPVVPESNGGLIVREKDKLRQNLTDDVAKKIPKKRDGP
jgi:hypothetical protein